MNIPLLPALLVSHVIAAILGAAGTRSLFIGKNRDPIKGIAFGTAIGLVGGPATLFLFWLVIAYQLTPRTDAAVAAGTEPPLFYPMQFIANMPSQHRRSWVLIAAYTLALLLISLFDFGAATTWQAIFRGVYLGMLVFMVASGLSLIFGLLDVLNFAQGAFLLIGAYVGWEIYDRLDYGENLRFLAAVLGAVIFMGIQGAFFEISLIRPLYERPIFQIVLTFGLGSVLLDLIERRYEVTPKAFAKPPVFDGDFMLLGEKFQVYDMFVILLGFVMMLGVFLLLNRTRIGIIIRAGIQDSEMVQALGINVRQVFTLVFIVGAALAALGGAVLVPVESATLDLGNKYLFLAIVVIVIGGMGSFEGTAVACLLVGLTRDIAERLELEHMSTAALAEASPLVLMIAILLVQPSGLFGRE
ncbi:MAG: branched-chain amino acid ABC transporter permease [Chloroflexi bacterium]|nr:branched-chain amino acid ABC transporter permease [Chloroflexota bacterium]